MKTMKFRLACEPRGAVKQGDELVRDHQRYASLPDRPTSFTPQVGGYQYISDIATKLNEAQLRSGFLDYLYSPDPV